MKITICGWTIKCQRQHSRGHINSAKCRNRREPLRSQPQVRVNEPCLAEVTNMPARDRPADRLHQPILDKIHLRCWRWQLADLHAICTRSASLLHTRELRCCDK